MKRSIGLVIGTIVVALLAGCGAGRGGTSGGDTPDGAASADLAAAVALVACQTDRRTVIAAVAAYRAMTGAYPESFDQLVAGFDPDGDGPGEVQQFISQDPTNADYGFTLDASTGAVTATSADAGLAAACNS